MSGVDLVNQRVQWLKGDVQTPSEVKNHNFNGK
jgi:hypothetical protein